MRTSEVTDTDFIEIAQTERDAHSGSSTFTLETTEYGTANLGFHTVSGTFIGVSLMTESPPPDPTGYNIHFDGKDTYVFPEQNCSTIQTLLALRKQQHPAAPFAERVFANAQPRYVSPIGAAALIRYVSDRDPSRVLFFTGAGISLGGEVPISDHSHLLGALGISEGTNGKSAAQNNDFCRRFITEDGHRSHVFAAFSDSLERFYADASSPAHCAIAGIVRAMQCRSIILTTNHDLKHESQGSRLRSVKVPPYWHSDNCRRPDLAPAVRDVVREYQGAVDLMVVAGVRRDYRRLLEGFKGGNTQFRVLSINNDQQPQPYLGSKDYYLRGNAQETLPDVADAFLASSVK